MNVSEANGDGPAVSILNLQPAFQRLISNIESVVLGKPEIVRLALTAMLAEGHILIEDVPGVGKTLLARALAGSLDAVFRRIQCTPDLLPSDILGSTIYQPSNGEFVFKPGPLFSQVVLADEINRTTPRTQSALLEAMSDRQVSIDGQTHLLASPFIVVATQNPFEFEGTYALPESQLDRFMIRLSMGYPERSEEKRLLQEHRGGEPVDSLKPVMGTDELVQLQLAVRQVRVDETVNDYLIDLIHGTRSHEEVQVGVSTRGALTLYRASQAHAVVAGRDFVTPDDIKTLAVPVLAHRIVGKSFLQAGEFDASEAIVRDLLERLRVPA